MNRRIFLTTFAATCLAFALPSFAEETAQGAGVQAMGAYAISSGAVGKTGAIFLTLHNTAAADDRLVDARADVAQRVELHTHRDNGDGVMQMIHLTEGMPLAAGEMHELARGGDHVMLMGLTRELKDGDTFPLTLVFENAPEMVIDVTVDNAPKPAATETGTMQGMDH